MISSPSSEQTDGRKKRLVESEAVAPSLALPPGVRRRDQPVANWRHGNTLLRLYRIIAVALFLLAWQLMAGHAFPLFTVSRPTLVATALYHYLSSAGGWSDIRVTCTEYALGFAIGSLSGLFIGLLFSTLKLIGRIFEPMLAAANAVPVITLAPLFVILFGLGIWSKVAIASIAIFFITFWNVYIAVRNTPNSLIDMLRVTGGRRIDLIRFAVIPSITPAIFSSLRLAVSVAMLGSIIGEFVVSVAGIGHYIEDETQLFQTANVMAGIIVAVTIVLLSRGIVVFFERRVTRWQRQ